MEQSPLAAQVSVFRGASTVTPVEIVALGDMLRRMQDGTYRQHTMWLRSVLASGNTAGYKRGKEQSMAFTPCCAMRTRAKKIPWAEKLLRTTGLVHFDLDHVDDPEALKRQLAQDSHVVFAFISPSGHGLKIGIAVTGTTGPEDYKRAWALVLDVLKHTYPEAHFNEDKQVKFLNALCYVSYDPALYANGDAIPFRVPPPTPQPAAKPAAQRPWTSGETGADERDETGADERDETGADERDEVEDVLRYIPADDRTTWVRMGMALHASQEPWARAAWDAWSQQSKKYDAKDQKRVWESFKAEGNVTLGSLFYEAAHHGYVPPKLITHKQGVDARPVPALTQSDHHPPTLTAYQRRQEARIARYKQQLYADPYFGAPERRGQGLPVVTVIFKETSHAK